MRLNNEEKRILRGALSHHYEHMSQAAKNCQGSHYKTLYYVEAAQTIALLCKLVGKDEKAPEVA